MREIIVILDGLLTMKLEFSR